MNIIEFLTNGEYHSLPTWQNPLGPTGPFSEENRVKELNDFSEKLSSGIKDWIEKGVDPVIRECSRDILGVEMNVATLAAHGFEHYEDMLISHLNITQKDMATFREIPGNAKAEIRARLDASMQLNPDMTDFDLSKVTDGLVTPEQYAALERIAPVAIALRQEVRHCVREHKDQALEEESPNAPLRTPPMERTGKAL